jgi:hypothetical protein
MWHWNSLWAPAPGDPPAVDDPILWRSPWSAEQSIALQARTWDTLVSTSRTWWSFWLAAWPLPLWQQVGELPPIEKEAAETPLPPPRAKPSVAQRSQPARARRQSSRSGARDGLGTHHR